jgi:hypothetical protein
MDAMRRVTVVDQVRAKTIEGSAFVMPWLQKKKALTK